ncbi:PE-PGRS family protein OS=Novosphingobium aromaticivorans (strain DSM 12444 / F199) GN=Saro_2740 PE=4 SV=1 [Gemmataceae bacterium]|nr:PE-PGRS family protein OS=Novosphingobium aromaticivorans (strain DSM 12444 / F199) GN=Saro_2740 PE=4 SV=1 [Gemmataceae bacterium]VTT96579.1 PE-PGRS family protein OS=Novosphingobium aromaticivorans (strain DSM 12444 / F199) GN=Saro_2740 PE=4 SV=1 [Gemmataceae bacterium]
MPTTIKLRNGTAAAWTSANPTLAAGEAGVETDTKKVKVGDGSTAWNSLAYIGGTGTITALTGDVTASGTGSVAATIANDAVTYAKMQNVSATDKLLGRATAGAGDVEEIACTAAGRALLDDADATAQRTTLGLGTLATQSGTFSGTSSGTNTGDQTITLTGDVTGSGTGSFAATLATVPVAKGGTGQTTAADAINALVPTQSGNAGKFLKTDGSAVSWDTPTGTVVTGRAVMSATQGITGSASFQDITDLSLTLPGAGTYLVNVYLYGILNGSGSSQRMYGRVVLNGSAVTDSNFGIVQAPSGSAAAAAGAELSMVVTATGAHVLKVQAARAMTGGTWSTSNIQVTSGEMGGYLEYVQLPGIASGSGTAAPANLLVNGDFKRNPRQPRTTLTSYATDLHGPTNWYLQHNGSSDVQLRNWSQGDSTPPASFAELGPSYLQVKNNAAGTRSFALCQFIEANGPNGLAAASLQATAIAAGFRAIASTGTPTLKVAVREWTGTADAPTKPVASWSSGVPTFQATNYASVATGSAALNTSTATPVTASGTPSGSCVGLWVICYVESLAAGASVYVGQAQLVRGSQVPTWEPHPADESLCLRYCESSYAPGVGPGTASTATGMTVCPTPASIANGGLVGGVRYAVTKRATPSTVGTYNYAGTVNTFSDYANNNLGTATVANSAATGFAVQNGTGGAVAPASGGCAFHWFSSAEISPT